MAIPVGPRVPRLLAILTLLAAGPGACGREPRPVKIGYASGVNQPNAGNVAQEAIDASWRPGTPVVRIVTGDPAAVAEAGASLLGEVGRAIRLSAMADVIAVVGPGGSREALQSAPIYREAGIPNVVPTATSRRMQDPGVSAFVLAPSDSLQGEFIGEFAASRLRARRALVFYLPDEYGLGLSSGAASALRRRGIELLGDVPVRAFGFCPPERKANDYRDVVTAALQQGMPDVVILATRTNEGACLARAVRQRLPAVRFVGGDGVLVNPLFLSLTGEAVDSFFVIAFWSPTARDTASLDFIRRFQAVTGRTPRSDDAMFYDATMLLAEAARAAGPSRNAVHRYLESLGRTRPPYAGVTGPIAFGPDAPRPMIMTRIRGGRPEQVPPQ